MASIRRLGVDAAVELFRRIYDRLRPGALNRASGGPGEPDIQRSVHMIVVTTPPGNIGHHVVRHLLDAGEAVRVIVHDAGKLPPAIRDRAKREGRVWPGLPTLPSLGLLRVRDLDRRPLALSKGFTSDSQVLGHRLIMAEPDAG